MVRVFQEPELDLASVGASEGHEAEEPAAAQQRGHPQSGQDQLLGGAVELNWRPDLGPLPASPVQLCPKPNTTSIFNMEYGAGPGGHQLAAAGSAARGGCEAEQRCDEMKLLDGSWDTCREEVMMAGSGQQEYKRLRR